MRKALFAVVLVAASFGGGAAVNGPGLRWAQAWAMGRLGLVQEADGAGPIVGPRGDATSDDLHASPIPPLTVEPRVEGGNDPKTSPDKNPSPAGDPARAPATNRPDRPAAPAPGGPNAPEPAVAGSGAPPSTPDPLEPLTSAGPPPLERPAPLAALHDPDPSPGELGKTGEKEKTRDQSAAPAPKGTHAVSEAAVSLASLARPAAEATAASSSSSSSSSAVAADPSDWAGVRRALRALGVSRYGIDGEPNGRVRFHCVIPLAGRHAVGQHFEAEADDELQAARAALRRIALWRASEGSTP